LRKNWSSAAIFDEEAFQGIMTISELEPTFVPPGELLADIRALIAEARRQTTVAVNINSKGEIENRHMVGNL
jgi:hypothetical protein